MEKHWLRREGADRLAIFMLGWAADHTLVGHIRPPWCDVLCVYDYRETEGLPEVTPYRDKYLFAWSFGVLMAEVLLGHAEFTRAVALNGTPLPADDRFGIGRRRLDLTLRQLATQGMEQFDRRAYGEHYKRLLSPRSLQDNIQELRELQHIAETQPHAAIKWDKAIVGERDVIFPPQNMLAYWGERAELLSLPHYPFADADIIMREIDNR